MKKLIMYFYAFFECFRALKIFWLSILNAYFVQFLSTYFPNRLSISGSTYTRAYTVGFSVHTEIMFLYSQGSSFAFIHGFLCFPKASFYKVLVFLFQYFSNLFGFS
jgi:hypothetical protein